MKIIVLGANGQLGRSIKDISSDYPQYDFLFTDVDTLDITDYRTVETCIAEQKPAIIINCAAYTAVDKAESEETQALLLNTKVVDNLSKLASENDVFLIHISTDYVFDGKKKALYTEDDEPCPLSVYGKTKLLGEQAMMGNFCHAAIVRTSWLYSEYGNNFVKTMMRLGRERQELSVVNDQIGSPTYAGDLARVIMEIANRRERINQTEIYHYSNNGIASWCDFAKEIMQLSKCPCKILPIFTDQYPTPAQRPIYSVLDKQKIRLQFSVDIPLWTDSLEKCIKKMLDLEKNDAVK